MRDESQTIERLLADLDELRDYIGPYGGPSYVKLVRDNGRLAADLRASRERLDALRENFETVVKGQRKTIAGLYELLARRRRQSRGTQDATDNASDCVSFRASRP